MDNQSKYIKLHVDSMIRLRALENDLNKVDIPSLIKNLSESARLGGFGSFDNANELYIFEEDFEKASKVLENFKADVLP